MKMARSYIERVVHRATKELLEEEMVKIDFIFINMLSDFKIAFLEHEMK